MGARGTVLLGFAFLLSGGNVVSAARGRFGSSANDTFDRTSEKPAAPTSQLPAAPTSQLPAAPTSQLPAADPQLSDVERRDAHAAPRSYRLRSLQLWSKHQPAPPTAENRSLNPQRSAGETLTGSPLRPGPDLNPLHPQSKVAVEFEQRTPVPADSVSVHCGEEKVIVEVNEDFLGNGQLIRPADLTLGGCPALDAGAHVLQFQTELQGCGSTVTMNEDVLVYVFTLMYSPTPVTNTAILRTNPTEVGVQCLYQRRQRVSSGGVRPSWNQLSAAVGGQRPLHFSLRLMTEDWRSPRPSRVYFLSDVMHVEASVLQTHHVPLRVYVDSCVASTGPRSRPRYSFISNHGCFTDSKLTGAESYFLQRSQEDKLHFQLKAFKFLSDDERSLYITCRLKATAASAPVDSQHKACSYLTEAKRWVASGGDNEVCRCCETGCVEQRVKRSLADDGPGWEGTASLGPILLEAELMERRPQTAARLQTSEAVWSWSAALMGGAGAALGLLMMMMGAVICCRPLKPPGYSVST